MNGSLTFWSMLPEHLLLLGIVLMLGFEILPRWSRSALPVAAAVIAVASGVAAWMYATGFSGTPFAGQFSVVPATSIAKAIVLGLAVPVLLMSRDEFTGGEFPAMILASLYGVCLLISGDSFLTLFLGLELMSLPVYTLVVLAYRRHESAESALKYLVLGGAATAMFLMGVSLLYGVSAGMGIGAFVNALGATDIMSRAAVVLILVSLFMKGAVVPFHGWAPDAYEGASISVTAYMATIVKAGVLFAIVRLFADAALSPALIVIIAVFPLLSIVWGNLAAMRQMSFRRMIAYSSIAHAGYLFYALLGAGAGRMQAVTFYLLTYGVLNLLAFAALPGIALRASPRTSAGNDVVPDDDAKMVRLPDATSLRRSNANAAAASSAVAADDVGRDSLETLRGLYHRDPFAAIVIAIAMLSLAGLPPFPGFVAKFLIFRNVLAAGYTTYAVIGLIGSYIGIYFYLRVVQFMFMGSERVVLSATVHSGDGHDEQLEVRQAYDETAQRAAVVVADGVDGARVWGRMAVVVSLAATLLVMIFPGWVVGRL